MHQASTADESCSGRIHLAPVAETVNGLYKAELIYRRGPWRTIEQVELATAAWVHWWNVRRLHGACGMIPLTVFEANHYHRAKSDAPQFA